MLSEISQKASQKTESHEGGGGQQPELWYRRRTSRTVVGRLMALTVKLIEESCLICRPVLSRWLLKGMENLTHAHVSESQS